MAAAHAQRDARLDWTQRESVRADPLRRSLAEPDLRSHSPHSALRIGWAELPTKKRLTPFRRYFVASCPASVVSASPFPLFPVPYSLFPGRVIAESGVRRDRAPSYMSGGTLAREQANRRAGEQVRRNKGERRQKRTHNPLESSDLSQK